MYIPNPQIIQILKGNSEVKILRNVVNKYCSLNTDFMLKEQGELKLGFWITKPFL